MDRRRDHGHSGKSPGHGARGQGGLGGYEGLLQVSFRCKGAEGTFRVDKGFVDAVMQPSRSIVNSALSERPLPSAKTTKHVAVVSDAERLMQACHFPSAQES
jgi:hypothetical protein